jgi:uncharacterized protein (TIGR02118 family)
LPIIRLRLARAKSIIRPLNRLCQAAFVWSHELGTRRSVMKVIFVLFRRADLTHEQSLAEWNGTKHVSLARKLPGLRKWVQNQVISLPTEHAADGIGELWFDSKEALEQAMASPQMAAAVEDAKRFLDMERTYAVVVNEQTVIGEAAAV